MRASGCASFHARILVSHTSRRSDGLALRYSCMTAVRRAIIFCSAKCLALDPPASKRRASVAGRNPSALMAASP